jgi:hypothetical protein
LLHDDGVGARANGLGDLVAHVALRENLHLDQFARFQGAIDLGGHPIRKAVVADENARLEAVRAGF